MKEEEQKNTNLEAGAQKEPVAPSEDQKKQEQTQEPEKSKKRQPQPSRRWKTSRAPQEDSGLIEKVIKINRVSKSTKGGKNMSFSALVVVGDAKGKAGYNLGKANDVAGAIRKALIGAKKNMINIPMQGSTITHEIIGSCGAAKVLLKPASEGTGVIASGPVRAVCDAAGIRNILTKCHRSNNPLNVVKATMDGFGRLKSEGLLSQPEEQGNKDATS